MFQSTRPVKGATALRVRFRVPSPFQSTRPVKGATGADDHGGSSHRVSIHAPREGRDANTASTSPYFARFQSTRPVKGATPRTITMIGATPFQSTRPVKGATHWCFGCCVGEAVSIHAPREGRDGPLVGIVSAPLRFQSTRPVKGATPVQTTRA